MCEGGLRFYAGVPLKLETGERIGTLTIVDIVPRTLTEQIHADFRTFAAQIVALLALQR